MYSSMHCLFASGEQKEVGDQPPLAASLGVSGKSPVGVDLPVNKWPAALRCRFSSPSSPTAARSSDTSLVQEESPARDKRCISPGSFCCSGTANDVLKSNCLF